MKRTVIGSALVAVLTICSVWLFVHKKNKPAISTPAIEMKLAPPAIDSPLTDAASPIIKKPVIRKSAKKRAPKQSVPVRVWRGDGFTAYSIKD